MFHFQRGMQSVSGGRLLPGFSQTAPFIDQISAVMATINYISRPPGPMSQMMNASRRCSHGKQVAGGSHADSVEFSQAEKEGKPLHALKVCATWVHSLPAWCLGGPLTL